MVDKINKGYLPKLDDTCSRIREMELKELINEINEEIKL